MGYLWILIPIAAIIYAGFREWLKFKHQIGASASEIDRTVKTLQEEFDSLRDERTALVQRVQNLEAIAASEEWDTLGGDRELAQAKLPPLELPETDRDADTEEVARMARRLRQ